MELKVEKKRVIEYSNYSRFSSKNMEDLNRLFYYLGFISPVYSLDDVLYREDIEIYKPDLIDQIIKLKEEGEVGEEETKCLEKLGLSLEQFISIVENYLSESDPSLDYLFLSWV